MDSISNGSENSDCQLILKINLNKLKYICNPFICEWPWGVKIDKFAVLRFCCGINLSSAHPSNGDLRETRDNTKHEKRIAWFILNGWNDPIDIDCGCPFIPGGSVDWIVQDGNHRLAAAIILRHPYIISYCSGSLEEIEKLKWKEPKLKWNT